MAGFILCNFHNPILFDYTPPSFKSSQIVFRFVLSQDKVVLQYILRADHGWSFCIGWKYPSLLKIIKNVEFKNLNLFGIWFKYSQSNWEYLDLGGIESIFRWRLNLGHFQGWLQYAVNLCSNISSWFLHDFIQ